MKRGIILLLNNIAIRFNKKDFEYDVYSLVKAFYPQAQITMFYEGEEEAEGEYGMFLLVAYGSQEICLAVERDGTEIFRQQVAVEYEKDRPETKNVLKRLVYGALCQVTGRTLPWGDLTGIRPTKIPMKLLEEGWKNTEIARYMRETYGVSNEKTALAITIANREKALLQDLDYENGYSLYVGIPFCPSICLYCSFGSHPLERWTKRVDEYLDTLCKELTFIREQMGTRKLTTVYIGGGTPTTLEPEQLRRLLSHIQETFDFTWVKEYTVEAGRPDSITEEKLKVIKNHDITRISINPQSMQQKTLDVIGRKHTVEEIKEAYALARKTGFDNINMDIIAGLPGEDISDMEDTLAQIAQMHPDSLTVHSLAIKRAARMEMEDLNRDAKETHEILSGMIERAAKAAKEMDLFPYYLYRQKNIAGNFENVGYAKVDKAGIYNILIMEEKQSIIAAGAGASTKIVLKDPIPMPGSKKKKMTRLIRQENVKAVDAYIDRIDEMIERKGEWLWH